MNRCYGMIGFALQETSSPGVWEEKIVERPYYYNVERNTRRYDTDQQVLDSLHLTNRISLIADSLLLDKLYAIRYVVVERVRWKITDIEIQRPRIFLTLGGVYNGSEPANEEDGEDGGESDESAISSRNS